MSMRKVRALFVDQRGLSTVEYTVLLVLVVTAAVKAWSAFGASVVTKVEQGTSAINDLGGSTGGSN
jgi:Flp pilus assembly pilin Flp